jgi:hypothetical protein
MVVWLCHARVGHRQGPYTEQPSPDTVGVFLFSFWLFSFLALPRRASRAATDHRQGPYTEQPSPDTVGVFLFSFWLFSVAAARIASERQPDNARGLTSLRSIARSGLRF